MVEAGLGETKDSREYKVETENDTVIPAKVSNWKTNHNEASPGLVCPRNRRLGRELWVTTRARLVAPIWGLDLSKVWLMAEEGAFYQRR